MLQTVTEQVVAPSPPPTALLASQMGRNDLFEVRVFQEPDLSGVYRVGPDGTIDFPFCGRLTVTGQTTTDIANVITGCLKAGYLKNPQVTVLAREFQSKKVLIYGKVAKPGAYPYEDEMTILQALAVAGGLAQFAATNQVSVTRKTEEREERFMVPVQDIGIGRAPNFYLRPGDVIFVPESWN